MLLSDDLIAGRTPCLKQMVIKYRERPGTLIAVREVPREDVSKYGIIDASRIRPDLFLIKDLIEKPPLDKAPSNYGIVGRYILQPDIFKYLAVVPPGVGGEIQLTDALKALVSKEEVYAYQFEGIRFDLGDIPGFLKANIEMGLKHPVYGTEVKRTILDLLGINLGPEDKK